MDGVRTLRAFLAELQAQELGGSRGRHRGVVHQDALNAAAALPLSCRAQAASAHRL